jgi:hypothetical protein
MNTNDDPVFDTIDLTYHEQTYVRGKPKKYLLLALDLFKTKTQHRCIVEVGSVRSQMNHTIEEFQPDCCNDGHSTYFWAHYTDADTKIYSVDINPESRAIIESDTRLSKVIPFTGDAIEYLAGFEGEIDLLFLDAWDVIPGDPYAERHLDAYNTIKHKLATRCLILIDDTDIGGGGKGKYVIPQLFQDGFECIISGRQTLFCR